MLTNVIAAIVAAVKLVVSGPQLQPNQYVEPAQLVYDAFTLSNLSAEQFDQLLLDSNLVGEGAAFAEVEELYGVNGLFALGVAHLESSLGSYCANTNNLFGFKASSGNWMSFSTKRDCILYFGELISSNLYAGKSINQIANIYCPGSTVWSSDVQWLMSYHFNRVQLDDTDSTSNKSEAGLVKKNLQNLQKIS